MSMYSDNCCSQIIERVTVGLSVGSEVLKMSMYSDNLSLQIIERVAVVLSAESEVLRKL